MNIEIIFKTVLPIVREAGQLIKNSSKNIKYVETKSSPVDLVTEVDRKVEKLLFDSIKEKYPNHKFIGEESAEVGKTVLTSEPTWIIDPIDGTTNFVHSYPNVAISMGLAIEKDISLGIIYNPFEDKLYYAKKGEGAYCNDQRLKVSGQTELSKSLLVLEVGSQRDEKKINNFKDNFSFFLQRCHGIRMQGSAALNMCAVASGHADAYYEFGLHCWDMAAGYLIVKEAGGVCVDTEGGPLNLMNRRVLCAASSSLQQQITHSLKHICLESD